MSSNIVKPRMLGRLLSGLFFGVLVLFLVFGIIWLMLELSPLLLFVLVLFIVGGGYLGLTQLLVDNLSEFGFFWGEDVVMNALALRLTPEQVDSSWLLQQFFYVDRSRPLTTEAEGDRTIPTVDITKQPKANS